MGMIYVRLCTWSLHGWQVGLEQYCEEEKERDRE